MPLPETDAYPDVSVRLPEWIPHDSADAAIVHALREVRLPGEPEWTALSDRKLDLRVLELSRQTGRLVAEVRASSAPATLKGCRGMELYVRRGSVVSSGERLSPGSYLRLPADSEHSDQLELEADALITITMGQIAVADTEYRHIDTGDDEAWFDGPADGVQVLPLHGHGTANVMLVRWDATVAFHPNLDPAGEEVFVLSGALHDSSGTYAAGSWIRNPVRAWQSWAGTPGTLVWYKSGHFPASSNETRALAP